MGKSITFEEFFITVPQENQKFVKELHQDLVKHGCTMTIKEAKSGYMAAYLYQKKTIMNYVFRKKGLFLRLYGEHAKDYEACLDTLPKDMICLLYTSSA